MSSSVFVRVRNAFFRFFGGNRGCNKVEWML